jgi:beta-lactamase class A
MNKIVIILFGVLSSVVGTYAQSVTIDPSSQALIDAKNSAANPTKGILAPRLTTAQRTSPIPWTVGTLVYDTDTKSYWYHNGTLWQNMAAASSGISLPYDGTGIEWKNQCQWWFWK